MPKRVKDDRHIITFSRFELEQLHSLLCLIAMDAGVWQAKFPGAQWPALQRCLDKIEEPLT